MIESLQLSLAMLCLLAACSLSQERQEQDSVKEEIDREVSEMLCDGEKSGGGVRSFGSDLQIQKEEVKMI